MIRTEWHTELRLSTLEMEAGHYLDLKSCLALIPNPNHKKLWEIIHEHQEAFEVAPGSSHNHQSWKGGFINHTVEVMNIACQQYNWMNRVRRLPFELEAALEVLFLHDIEKPFKVDHVLTYKGGFLPATKENRKALRSRIIAEYEIKLTTDQENALQYVEGVPDSQYTPGERTMGELAAFCHCCDILSSRLWWDRGHSVPAPAWQY